ncbi:MAG: hypothetical protein CMP07_05140 [Xanthomonadales bacterium]|nr:hypothetical protein [Xanthomonadales bacterium]|tara:strand:- start:302 stop:1012 length:711 start_codon:yes stop_codon:yes gene_type:complete
MRSIALAIGLLALIPTFATAEILPQTEGYSVEVTFSDNLQQRMASINGLEQRLEARFRENRHYATSPREAGSQRFAKSRTEGTEWAGERLIGDVSDFTLDNLLEALVAYNVNRAAPDFEGRIEIHIDELKLTNPSIAFLESFQSYAEGRVKVTDADGNVLFDEKVRTNLVIDSTVDTSYDGPELAFAETDPSQRAGPTLAYFVGRALKRAWPERKSEIVGPVIIRVSGPNERVILD